jgi:uncharacterized membrane protein YfcA
MDPIDTRKRIISFFVGSLAGAMGSLVGMGGGFVALPFLTGNMLRLSQHSAHGTSMATVLFTSVGATIAYAYSDTSNSEIRADETWFGLPAFVGNIHTETTVCLASTAGVMAAVGAKISKRLPAKPLKAMLGVFMMCVAPLTHVKAHLLQEKKSSTSDHDAHNVKGDMISSIRTCSIGVASGLLAGTFGVGGGAIVVPALCVFTDLPYKSILGVSLAG